MRRKDLMLKVTGTLIRRRHALCRTLTDHERMIAVNDRPVGDLLDAAVDCEQDELDSQLAAAESRELAAIDAALKRIRQGLYGVCEGCGKPIPAARLAALPYTTVCIRCQREQEHDTNAREEWVGASARLAGDQNHSNGLELGAV